MLTEDWMMRQVEALARSIAYLVFQKEDAEIDELYRTLLGKVNAGDIGGAEDLLYQRAEPEDRRYLELAVDFYSRLNDLSDEQLEQGGFARDEVQDGLRNLAAQFGVSLL